jgi:MFS family permease
MAQTKVISSQQDMPTARKTAIGLWAVFITQFVSYLFINARNIATPAIVAEFDGMALFSWFIALPALAGSASTLLFGKLGDMYGRRAVLLASMALFGVGLALSTQVTSMSLLIASATFMSIGHFPIIPLCFTAVGDFFSARELAKWTGMLNLPTGVAALIGPVLGGIVTESVLGWRGLYWGTIPLLVTAAFLVAGTLPKNTSTTKPKVDFRGTLVMVLATTTLMLGFSRLGTPGSVGIGAVLLVVSVVAWASFIQIEKQVVSPILDPQVLFNRTFMTAAVAALLSFFGTLGIVAYSPIFAQYVMGVNPTISGSMLTPYTVIVAFMGIPAGFLLARTGKYKWMFNIGYAIVTLAMFAMWRFSADTPIWLYVLVTSMVGLGLGVIPTITTLVAQYAVPKRLLGAAVGAVFFFQMVGIAVAPAILGLVQNSTPDLESGLKLVFLVGAVTMMIALLLIITIPQVSVDTES